MNSRWAVTCLIIMLFLNSFMMGIILLWMWGGIYLPLPR